MFIIDWRQLTTYASTLESLIDIMYTMDHRTFWISCKVKKWQNYICFFCKTRRRTLLCKWACILNSANYMCRLIRRSSKPFVNWPTWHLSSNQRQVSIFALSKLTPWKCWYQWIFFLSNPFNVLDTTSKTTILCTSISSHTTLTSVENLPLKYRIDPEFLCFVELKMLKLTIIPKLDFSMFFPIF